MKHPLLTALSLTLSLLALPAQADWSDTWQKVKDYASDEVADLSDKIREAWEELEPNEYLQRLFGEEVDERSALIGTFYDLKQPLPETGARAATPHSTVSLIRHFVKTGWDTRFLEQYYSPKVRLYAPYFYLPRCKASYAPVAFQCEDQNVRPSCWVALYRGVVKAPKTGKFRFVGMGDDTLLVRFNNKTVFEYGWSIPSRNKMTLGTHPGYWYEITSRPKEPRALFQFDDTPHWNEKIGGLSSGKVFEVKRGCEYPIEVLISEIPGEEFGYALLLEEVGDTPSSGFHIGNPEPKLHLFRTNRSYPTREKLIEALKFNGVDYRVGKILECPEFEKDSLVWKVDYDQSIACGFLDHLLGNDDHPQGKNTAMGKQDLSGNQDLSGEQDQSDQEGQRNGKRGQSSRPQAAEEDFDM